MKVSSKNQKYWWTWHMVATIGAFKYDRWGMARIKHQGKSK